MSKAVKSAIWVIAGFVTFWGSTLWRWHRGHHAPRDREVVLRSLVLPAGLCLAGVAMARLASRLSHPLLRPMARSWRRASHANAGAQGCIQGCIQGPGPNGGKPATQDEAQCLWVLAEAVCMPVFSARVALVDERDWLLAHDDWQSHWAAAPPDEDCPPDLVRSLALGTARQTPTEALQAQQAAHLAGAGRERARAADVGEAVAALEVRVAWPARLARALLPLALASHLARQTAAATEPSVPEGDLGLVA